MFLHGPWTVPVPSSAQRKNVAKPKSLAEFFAAELQEKQAGPNPVLIRIETNAGHGAGTPVAKTIEQYADIFGFTLFNMGFDQLPNPQKKKMKS